MISITPKKTLVTISTRQFLPFFVKPLMMQHFTIFREAIMRSILALLTSWRLKAQRTNKIQ